jgi:DUF971 family protein
MLSLQNTALMGSELALAWSDGRESYLALEALRRACPCANCQGEPDALGRVVRPSPTFGPNAFTLKSWEIIGGYALQFRWGDGHSTGIYSYQYLREHVPANENQ